MLQRLRKGLSWLVQVHDAFLAGRAVKTTDADFTRILDECAVMEQTLRVGGYTGCIFGEAGPCPEEAIITCDACMPVTTTVTEEL